MLSIEEVIEIIKNINIFLREKYDLNNKEWRAQYSNSMVAFGMLAQWVLISEAPDNLGLEIAVIGEKLKAINNQFIEGN